MKDNCYLWVDNKTQDRDPVYTVPVQLPIRNRSYYGPKVYTAPVQKLYQIGGARSVTDGSEQCKRKADP